MLLKAVVVAGSALLALRPKSTANGTSDESLAIPSDDDNDAAANADAVDDDDDDHWQRTL